jgi:peroxiredoxin/outer membrane lipoprotein-sorting protein
MRLLIIHIMNSRVAWLVLVLPCLAPAAGPSAQEILTRTAATYKNLRSYQFRVTVQTVQGSNISERHFTESGAGPGRYRVQSDDPRGELRVGDGRAEWVFNQATGEYVKTASTIGTATTTGDFEHIDQHVTGASVAREELFAVDGKPKPIYVVNVTRDQWPKGALAGADHAMYRMDKSTFAVYKVIYYAAGTTEIVLYSPVKWDQPVPESLFTFTPPASARKVSAAATPEVRSSPIAGAEAPDFTLPDSGGHSVHLRDLRGKVLVVDFWATWCPPCRAQMPILQRMQTELASKGLVVLGLDIGEDAETVSAFAKRQSYTFALLLGAEPDVSAKYYVEAYPTTFVVDRRGRIAYRELGGSSPDKLRSAVQAALDAVK